MTTAGIRAALAAWALEQHSDGVREDGHTNDGEPVRRYAIHLEPPAPWCSRMVRAGLLHVGALVPGVNATATELYEMGSSRALYAWLAARGAAIVGPADVVAGDLRFLLGRGGSDPGALDGGIHHVGVVVGAGVGSVRVVDGNWSDRVSLNVERLGDPRSLWLRWPR